MRIDKQYQVWEAASKDDVRPVLTGVLIDRTEGNKGVAVAADGFMMAVVPVELEEEDVVPAILPAVDFKNAVKVGPKPWDFTEIVLRQGTAEYKDNNLNTHIVRLIEGQFPAYERLTPDMASYDPRVNGEVAVDPRRLLQCFKAIGAESGLRTTQQRPNDVIALESVGCNNTGPLVPPYALLMPMHASKSPAYRHTTDKVGQPESESEVVARLQEEISKLKDVAQDPRLGEVAQLRKQAEEGWAAARHNGNIIDDLRAEIEALKAAPAPAPAVTPPRASRAAEVLHEGDSITLVFPRSPREEVKQAIKTLGFTWAATKTWACHVNGNSGEVLARVQEILH